MKNIIFGSITLLIFLCSQKAALSWDNEVTHRDISEIAAASSVLSENNGNYLKNIGFDNGLMQELKWGEKKLFVKKWLAEGAYFEDEPFTRSLNHFHNPLKSWEQAGLNDVFSGKSSILWAQDSSNEWSWKKTRDYFYLALTSKTDAERQAYFAQTFKGLGHQMHLIQDAAQPDHVRNDAHPEDAIFGKNMLNSSAFFESWAKSERQRIIDLAANPVFQNVPFDVSYNGFAPITQFYDTDRYDGLNASAGINQGIAEYTNANFFSGDTIFAAERYSTGYKHHFPYPKKSSTDLQAYIAQIKPLLVQIAEDGIADKGMWIIKERDGETIDHLVRAGRWTSKIYKIFGEVPMFYRSFYRDEECHKDYVSLLIPRAVGYSSQALSYFFRAKMDLLPADPATDGFVIKNDTAETMEGEFHLYYDNSNDSRVEIQSGDFPINAMTVEGNGNSANVNFDAPSDAKKPGEYILAFRGKMGGRDRSSRCESGFNRKY
jgi:hypothetical protein